MKRELFLSIVSPLAMTIGFIALCFPALLLESKGVVAQEAVKVWMKEVGVLLLASGIIMFLVRNEKASLSLKAIFIGNIIIQLGLLIIEVIAYQQNTITEITGIIPNSILHIVLSAAFSYYLFEMNRKEVQMESQ